MIEDGERPALPHGRRAAIHAALGEPTRLAVVDLLVHMDRLEASDAEPAARAERRSGMRRAVIAFSLVVLAACGEGAVGPGEPQRRDPVRVEFSGTVLESLQHGPKLCLGVTLTSLPPQCGDVPIAGWDWDAVDSEERVSGTIWGEYHVVGSFDGATLTLTAPPGPPKARPAPDVDFTTPCPKPASGYARPDPTKTTQEDFDAATRAAQAEPDFSAAWVDYVVERSAESGVEPSETILNVAFTEDLERHEAELRRYWGGMLCVSKGLRTSTELRRIQSELHSVVRDLGMQLLSVGANEVHGVVDLTVVFADDEDRAAIDARFGRGVVRITSALQIVSS